jgi:hypothetical protein
MRSSSKSSRSQRHIRDTLTIKVPSRSNERKLCATVQCEFSLQMISRPLSMDAILSYCSSTTFAIEQMDRAVLESAKTAIVRSYREFELLETILDPAALAEPFNLRHITRALVRFLNAEGFRSYWDRSGIHGPLAVKVSWRVALKNASRAQRHAKKLQLKESLLTAHSHGRESILPTGCISIEARFPSSPRYAPSMVWSDAPILELEALANPNKVRHATESSRDSSPRYQIAEKAPFWKLCTLIFRYQAIFYYRPLFTYLYGQPFKSNKHS